MIIPHNDQAQVVKQDLRQLVQDTSIYPYNCIGKIVSKRYNPKTNKYLQKTGTGSIIHQNFILTSAHVLYFKQFEKVAEIVEFYPQNCFRDKNTKNPIRIQKFFIQKLYLISEQNKSLYDYAILFVPSNQLTKPNHILKCKFDYSFENYKNQLINISGYSGLMPNVKNCQYFQENKAWEQKSPFLFYKHTTGGGNSGGPVLLKTQQGSFEIIGIHKGSASTFNFCILLSHLKDKIQKFVNPQDINKIEEDFENSYISCYKVLQNSQSQNSLEISKLQEQIKRLTKLNSQLQEHLTESFLTISSLKEQNSALQQENKDLLSLIDSQNLKKKQTQLRKTNSFSQSPNKQSPQQQKSKSQIQRQSFIKVQQVMNILTKKIVSQSSIVKKPQEASKLFGFFPKPLNSIKLLYKASDHKFSLKKYFDLCGSVPNTLIVCLTNKSKIVGAYSPLSHAYTGKTQDQFGYCSDSSFSSFIFSLTQNDKFALKKQQCAVYHHKDSRYIVFGAGQLRICDQANKLEDCCSYINEYYFNKQYKSATDKDSCIRFTGNKTHKFLCKEWEVWKVQ